MKWRHIKDPSKYRAKKVYFDGYTFDSKKEAQRYKDLLLYEKAGEIEDLQIHPRLRIKINGESVCDYVGDFQYRDYRGLVIEDTKGVRTALYRLKKKLLWAIYKIQIVEI